MSRNKPLLAYFGHHKCASMWIVGIIRQTCTELGLKFAYVASQANFNAKLQDFVTENKVDFLAYVNADFEYVQQLENCIGFHVIRDPGDICVSAYFSHLYSHPTGTWQALIDHRKNLQTLPKEEGLLADMKFIDYVMHDIESWDYSYPNVLQIRVEDFARSPYQEFLNVFCYLGILNEQNSWLRKRLAHALLFRLRTLSRGVIATTLEQLPVLRLFEIVLANEYRKKSGGRDPGEEDPTNHYRKGIQGDWRNHFTTAHVEFFKQHYNQVLLKTGYEQDADW